MLDADATRLPAGRATGELRQYREMGDSLVIEYSIAVGHVEIDFPLAGNVDWD